jgi:predicted outer membrane repeat protein
MINHSDTRTDLKTVYSYIFLLLLTGLTQAATITVDGNNGAVAADGVCSINEAIINANNDAGTHTDCTAGSGADTIQFTADITLTAYYEDDASYGHTGTSAINSAIIIDGMGHTLQRDSSLTCNNNVTLDASEFRLLRISSAGDLDLKNIALKHGCANGSGHSSYGGAIFNDGTLAVNNSLLASNQALYSGAIENEGTITEINNSTFSGNVAIFDGGAIYNIAIISEINNSTFSGNTASRGGGIYSNGTISTLTLSNSLFHNNTGTNADCIFNLGSVSGGNNLSDQNANNCTNAGITMSMSLNVGPLADNGCVIPLADGGCIETHALLLGSDGRDEGDMSATTHDQRGFPVFGSSRDIGAFEYRVDSEMCNGLGLGDGFTTSVASADALNTAIECANVNGPASDTINLSADISLSTAYTDDAITGIPADFPLGPVGIATISSELVIDGQGYAVSNSNACNNDGTSDAGEFRLMLIDTGADVELNNITLENGCADGAGHDGIGAGIYFADGILRISNSSLNNNQSYLVGGGVYVLDESQHSNEINTINGFNSTFYANQSGKGGAIYANGEITSVIANSTFSANVATVEGAALWNNDSPSIVPSIIINSTFSGNTVPDGGGVIFNRRNMYLGNTLLHQSTDGSMYVAECAGTGTSNGDNNLSDNSSSGCPNVGTLTTASVAALADNGCLTPLSEGRCVKTHALLTGSEAIKAGALVDTTTDQRGFAAIDERDIGAYEYLSTTEQCSQLGIDTTMTFTQTVSNTAELNQAIICANANTGTTDTINLDADITYNSFYENHTTYGHTATAPITSAIILDGMGHTLQRNSSLTCNNDNTLDTSEFRLLRISSPGDLDLKNISLKHGCVDGFGGLSFGGAIYNEGTLAVNNSLLASNQALGAAAIWNEGIITEINNSTFSNNTGSSGGTIYNYTGTITEINNSTFSDNVTGDFGGAVGNEYGTISALSNSLFYNNTGSTTADCAYFGGGDVFGHNNLSDQDSNNCTVAGITESMTLSVGPLLDNGCVTPLTDGSCIQTHALLSGSDGIDGGDMNATTHDQRGFATHGAARDIGAFESQNDIIFQNGFE